MRRHSQLLAVLAVIAVVGLGGCVSSGKYRALTERARDAERDLRVLRERTLSLLEQLAAVRRENERLEQQLREAQGALPSLRDTVANCQNKLGTIENVSRAELLARLEGASQVMTEKEGKAYYRGVLDVWQALSVSGTPTEDKGLIFSDHYFTFRVALRGRSIYQFTVQTKSQEGTVSKAFGQILDVVQVAAAFVPK